MKKILVLSLAVIMAAGIAARAQVSDVSRRMAGLNPHLVGVVSDEYSDFMRVNTANILDVDGKRLYTNLSGLDTTGNSFLLGGVSSFGMGKLGGFAMMNNSKIEEDIHNWIPGGIAAGQTGDFSNAPGAEGEYEFSDSNNHTEKVSADAYDSIMDMNMDILVGIGTLDIGELGLRLAYRKDADSDIERDYSYSYSHATDQDDYLTMDYSSTLTRYESNIIIAPSIRGLQVMGADIGGTVEIGTIKSVSSMEVDSDFTQGVNFAPALRTPHFFAGLADDYARELSVERDEELTGLALGFGIDGSYRLNENANVKGAFMMRTGSASGEENYSWVDEVTRADALDTNVGKVSYKQDTDVENKLNQIAGIIGVERNISSDLLMGIGVGFSRMSLEEIREEERGENTDLAGVKTYDATTEETTTQTSDTSIAFPISLEWKANGWLKARMGASYMMNFSSAEREIVTTTYDMTDSTDKNADAVNVEKEKVTPRPVGTWSRAQVTPVMDQVSFYAGLGIQATDTLTIDLVNNNQNQLDLSNWQLGATLKF